MLQQLVIKQAVMYEPILNQTSLKMLVHNTLHIRFLNGDNPHRISLSRFHLIEYNTILLNQELDPFVGLSSVDWHLNDTYLHQFLQHNHGNQSLCHFL